MTLSCRKTGARMATETTLRWEHIKTSTAAAVFAASHQKLDALIWHLEDALIVAQALQRAMQAQEQLELPLDYHLAEGAGHD